MTNVDNTEKTLQHISDVVYTNHKALVPIMRSIEEKMVKLDKENYGGMCLTTTNITQDSQGNERWKANITIRLGTSASSDKVEEMNENFQDVIGMYPMFSDLQLISVTPMNKIKPACLTSTWRSAFGIFLSHGAHEEQDIISYYGGLMEYECLIRPNNDQSILPEVLKLGMLGEGDRVARTAYYVTLMTPDHVRSSDAIMHNIARRCPQCNPNLGSIKKPRAELTDIKNNA